MCGNLNFKLKLAAIYSNCAEFYAMAANADVSGAPNKTQAAKYVHVINFQDRLGSEAQARVVHALAKNKGLKNLSVSLFEEYLEGRADHERLQNLNPEDSNSAESWESLADRHYVVFDSSQCTTYMAATSEEELYSNKFVGGFNKGDALFRSRYGLPQKREETKSSSTTSTCSDILSCFSIQKKNGEKGPENMLATRAKEGAINEAEAKRIGWLIQGFIYLFINRKNNPTKLIKFGNSFFTPSLVELLRKYADEYSDSNWLRTQGSDSDPVDCRPTLRVYPSPEEYLNLGKRAYCALSAWDAFKIHFDETDFRYKMPMHEVLRDIKFFKEAYVRKPDPSLLWKSAEERFLSETPIRRVRELLHDYHTTIETEDTLPVTQDSSPPIERPLNIRTEFIVECPASALLENDSRLPGKETGPEEL